MNRRWWLLLSFCLCFWDIGSIRRCNLKWLLLRLRRRGWLLGKEGKWWDRVCTRRGWVKLGRQLRRFWLFFKLQGLKQWDLRMDWWGSWVEGLRWLFMRWCCRRRRGRNLNRWLDFGGKRGNIAGRCPRTWGWNRTWRSLCFRLGFCLWDCKFGRVCLLSSFWNKIKNMSMFKTNRYWINSLYWKKKSQLIWILDSLGMLIGSNNPMKHIR